MSRPYVDDVFDAVVDLDAARRDRVLGERCAGHPSVEAEVRALLAVAPGPARLSPGDELGDYRLVESLGAGAAATVWRAFDTRLRAWTALKILHPRTSVPRPAGDPRTPSWDAEEAVLREARAASAILSDHVVRVRTCGRAGEWAFVDMQLCAEYRGDAGGEVLVTGRSLADAPPADPIEAVRLVAGACRGVEDAHRMGVLHRDLKPANVLVTPISRRALVTDFGLAAAPLYPPPSPATPPTDTVSVALEASDGGALRSRGSAANGAARAVIVGTPPFMAPEVARGEPPTRASDVYGLGATLYALLAGRPPYVASEGAGVPALDVVDQVRRGPPAPLAVPARLAAIVRRAMHRDPHARYASAAALAHDLDAWLAGRATSHDGRAVALGLFALRHRGVVGTAALLGAMLAVSAAGLWWLDARRDELEREVGAALLRRDEAQIQADAAARVRAEALTDRDAALLARDAAHADAAAAAEARDAAREGQTAAERRAEIEIRARRAADDARVVAEVRRATAEVAARDAMARADLAEAELAVAIERRESAEQERDAAVVARHLAEVALSDAEIRVAESERLRADEERRRKDAEAQLIGSDW